MHKINNLSEYTGSRALLEILYKNGVQTMFGYPGGVLLGLYDEIYGQENIRHVLVRHEQAAAHAADGYARIAGKTGVCLATSGPGAANLVTGICNAIMDSVPVLALTGQVTTSLLGKDAFQEADLFNLSTPITKHSYLVHLSEELPSVIQEALKITTNKRPGPVLVDLPKDVLNSSFLWDGQSLNTCDEKFKKTKKITEESLLKACDMILSAENPVLYIGGGVIGSNASDEIIELLETYKIPVTWTLMGKGAVSDYHELNLGMIGMHGTPAANYSVYESDLLIAVGVRFDDRATGNLESFAPKANVIHIDIDSAEIGKNRPMNKNKDVSLVGDAKEILKELLKKLHERKEKSKPKTEAWLAKINNWKKDYSLDEKQHENYLAPQDIFRILNEVFDDAIFTTDVGQNQMWAAQYLKIKKPRRWVTSGGLGTMGFGLPSAIGAKAAAQDLGLDIPCVSINGDGGFQMSLQELATIKSHNIPVIVLVLNNQTLGMVRQWQELFYEKHYSCSHLSDGSPDFVKLAEAYGFKASKVENPKDLKSALIEARDSGEPVLIDMKVHPEANVFPIVPPGQANHHAEGINQSTMPINRPESEYLKLVEKAPVNKSKTKYNKKHVSKK